MYLPKSALTWLSQIMGLVVLSACVGGQVSAADADEQVRSAGGPDSPSQSAASQPAKKQPAKPKEKSDTFEATAPAQEDMADLQSVDAFNSIEDGQPGAPGERELQIDAGWRTRPGSHDPFTLHTEIKYTPTGSDFLRNMKLELSAPLELGLGGTPGNGDLVLGWKQRWVTDHDWVPSLSTLAEVRAPSGYRSSGVDGTLTGIVAKQFGPGTAFLNSFAKSANGENVEDLRHFQWGFVAGYKWRTSDRFALIGDYVQGSSEQTGHGNINELEFSGMYRVNDHVTFGPGIFVGLDRHEETPNFGAGFRLQFSF